MITFFSIALFISLFLMTFTLILSSSLKHDTLQPALKIYAGNMLRDYASSQDIFSPGNQANMKNYCSISTDYRFIYNNYSIVIPCQVIENGTDAAIDYSAGYIIDQIYSSEYNCEFWQCVKDSSTPFVLVSQKSRDYWRGKFAVLLGLSFIIFASIFLISRNRTTTLIVSGVLIIFAAFPFRKLNWALTFVPEKLSGIFSVFFTKAHGVFAAMLIIGVIFIGAGILFKILGWDMKFNEDFQENEEAPKKVLYNLKLKKK